MRNPSIHNGFFDEDSPTINRQMITLPSWDDASDSWLISSPSTTIVSRMHLSKSRSAESSPYSYSSSPPSTPRKNSACEASSRELQQQLSSPPPAKGRDTTTSPSNYHINTSKAWDSYWSSPTTRNQSYHIDPSTGSPLRHEDTALSPLNRNFASSNLSLLNVSSQTDLHRSGAVRATPQRTIPPVPSYSAFPNTPQPRTTSSPHTRLHNSWPTVPSEPQVPRPRLRSRAQTTPSKSHSIYPSNLSACTSVSQPQSAHGSSASDSPLYICSTNSTSLHGHPLMDLMQQKSVFEDDDDEEKHDDETSKLAALKMMLNRRGSGNNENIGVGMKRKSPITKADSDPRKRKGLRRSTEKAFKGIFGRKRVVTG